MDNYTLQEKLALARRMRLRGVPLEIEDDDLPRPASQRTGLIIRQMQGSGKVTQLNEFEVGYSVCIRILNNFRAEFWISGFGLQLPWEDPLFLLDDPAEFGRPSPFYCFFGSRSPAFPRDKVLNHYYRRYELSRGRPLEGFLLWSGRVSIPERYFNGNCVEAFVVVVDQFGDKYSEPVSLKVERRNPRVPPHRTISHRNITGKTVITTSHEEVPEHETSGGKVVEFNNSNTPVDADAVTDDFQFKK